MCVTNFIDWERGDGMCGLICLMVMFTGNTKRVAVKLVGNKNKLYSFMNTSKIIKRIKPTPQ